MATRLKNTAQNREVYHDVKTHKPINLAPGQEGEFDLSTEAVAELRARAEKVGSTFRGILVLDGSAPKGVATLTEAEQAAADEKAARKAKRLAKEAAAKAK